MSLCRFVAGSATYVVVKSHYGFATAREIKSTSQHCCNKTMDNRMALYRDQCDISNMTKDLFGIGFDMLFSELY